MNTLEQVVATYCARELADEPKPCRVMIAVSGGADSMALLRAFLAVASAVGDALEISACHVNHGMRGARADADETFVCAECTRLCVPLVVHRACDAGKMPPEGAGENWARILRYDFFATEIAQKGVFIATAHTANDQAETLLFRLARGTGAHGAAGIRPRRDAYLRPLLSCTRAQIEAYCAEIGQAFITDETNVQTCYARNRLRHGALPALVSANTGAVAHMVEFCEKMAEMDAYFDEKATLLLEHAQVEADVWALACLVQAEPLVLETAIHHLVRQTRDAEKRFVADLCALVQSGTGAVQLTASVRFFVQGRCLKRTQCGKNPIEQDAKSVSHPLAEGKFCFPGGYFCEISFIPIKNMEKIQSVHKKDLKNAVDYAKMVTSPLLRCRQEGDRFAPQGRGCTKTLKKFFNEQAIPEQARWQTPLLACANDVVWVWGQGVAEGFAPDASTTMIVNIIEGKFTEEEK